MTYRHIKFVESPVMRSLEKKAIENGWIQPKQAEIKKEASSNFEISDNFDVNIANLISGLKKEGMDKLAKEVQDKFVAYKQSETKLYNLKHNNPNDLVEEAHPDGSVDLDLGGDSVVEDIYDIHTKLMNIVNNKKKINKSAQTPNSNYIKNILYKNLSNVFGSSVKVPSLGGVWNTPIESFVNSLGSTLETKSRMENSTIYDLSQIALNDLRSALGKIKEQKNISLSVYKNPNDENRKQIESNYILVENSFINTINELKSISQSNSVENNLNVAQNTKQTTKFVNEYDKQKKYEDLFAKYITLYKTARSWISGAKIETEDQEKKQLAQNWINSVNGFLNNLKVDLQKLSTELNNYFLPEQIELAKESPENANVGPMSFNGSIIKFNGFVSFTQNFINVNRQINNMFEEQ